MFITKQQIRVFFYDKKAEQCSSITFSITGKPNRVLFHQKNRTIAIISIMKQRKSVCCNFFHQKEAKKATRSLLFYITRRRIVSFYPEFEEPCVYHNKSAKSRLLLSSPFQNSQIVFMFITKQRNRVLFFVEEMTQFCRLLGKIKRCFLLSYSSQNSEIASFYITKQKKLCLLLVRNGGTAFFCHFFH